MKLNHTEVWGVYKCFKIFALVSGSNFVCLLLGQQTWFALFCYKLLPNEISVLRVYYV
jgi:hypothetical protein